jgi:hypothetical protein
MPAIKAFLETTIFNRYFEDNRDYNFHTKQLFGKIQAGDIEAYTSQQVIEELLKAKSPKREQMLGLIVDYKIPALSSGQNILDLADNYVDAGIIPERFRLDGVHIATATINNLDCIISLNFHHINRLKTRNMVEAVNSLNGYSTPVICGPAEVIYGKD